MNKEKTIFLVREEKPFPDIGILKKLNKIYWNFIFNFIVLRKIRKYRKNKDFMVVSDLQSYNKIKKVCENVKSFYEYITIPKECEDPYEETIKLAYKFAENFRETFIFENHDIINYISEELAYDLVNFIEEFKIIKEISEREKVREFLSIGKEQRYIKVASVLKNTKRISFISLSDFLINLRKFLRRYSLGIRQSFPTFFNNQEFIKQNKISKNIGKKILFAGFDIKDIERIMPLIELTRKRNKKFIVLTNYKNSKQFLEERNIPYIFFGDYLNKKDRKIINKKRKELIKKWKEVKNRGKLFYQGVNIWKAIEPELEYRFFTRAPWTMHYILSSKKLLKNINLIVNEGDLSPRCRSLVEVGKRMKIPSLCIQEGATIIKDSPRGFFPLISNKIAAWGQSSKEYLKGLRINKKRIEITGCSKFDPYLKQKHPEKKEKLIILATEPSERGYFMDKERVEIIKTVAEVMKEFPEYKLLIKQHPREETDAYKILRDLKIETKNIRIMKEEPIEDLIRASEMLININSTVAIETILIGKPLINIDIFNCRPEISMFTKFNTSILVKNGEQLRKAIKKILSKNYMQKYEKSKKKFLEWYLYKMDGKSSGRILALIENMISQSF